MHDLRTKVTSRLGSASGLGIWAGPQTYAVVRHLGTPLEAPSLGVAVNAVGGAVHAVDSDPRAVPANCVKTAVAGLGTERALGGSSLFWRYRPMKTLSLRQAAAEVGLAIRRPEQLALRWQHGDARALRPLLLLLLANAFFGLAVYGSTN